MTTSITWPESRCRVGLARADITPPVGIYHRMWGAAMHDRATGVHRPLTATAMVVAPQDAATGGEVVWVDLDHCLLWNDELDEVAGTVCAASNTARQNLILLFSHTHSAGLMGRERIELPGGELIGPYLQDLACTLGGLVNEARRSLEASIVTYGRGSCSMAAHRDFWDEARQEFVCGFNPDGAADPTVTVARIADLNGRTRAVLVNYACHPTTLAYENTLISPDYVGALREIVQRETLGLCLFMQGASGDLGPRHGMVGDTAVADGNGRQLALAVLQALEGLPPPGHAFCYAGAVVSGATLGVWNYRPVSDDLAEAQSHFHVDRFTVPLAYRPDFVREAEAREARDRHLALESAARSAGDVLAARDERAHAERMTRQLVRLRSLPHSDGFPLPVQTMRLGDAIWVAVEGEHYQYLQLELRRRFAPRPILVATIANGSRCIYLPTADTYGKGIYQESIALLAKGSLEQLVTAIGDKLATHGA